MSEDKRDPGQASVLIVGMLMVLLVVGGLVFDGSRAFLLRRNLQNAVDAAVLAGAEKIDVELWKRSGGAVIDIDRESAIAAARGIFRERAPYGSAADFDVSGTRVFGRGRCRIDFFLLALVGISGYDIEAGASASPVFLGRG